MHSFGDINVSIHRKKQSVLLTVHDSPLFFTFESYLILNHAGIKCNSTKTKSQACPEQFSSILWKKKMAALQSSFKRSFPAWRMNEWGKNWNIPSLTITFFCSVFHFFYLFQKGVHKHNFSHWKQSPNITGFCLFLAATWLTERRIQLNYLTNKIDFMEYE